MEHELNIARPSPARMYDYWLGGRHNFEADRRIVKRINRDNPQTVAGIRGNRAFLRRAVTYLVDQGITQFLDLGSGIPTVGNVHEIAQQADPSCTVVYVDRDVSAVTQAQRLLRDNPRATVVRADIRDPRAVTEHPDVRALLDFSRPLGVLMVAVLHFVRDAEHPEHIIAGFRRVMASGSMLVMSHGALDGITVGERRAIVRYNREVHGFVLRTREQLRPWFGGFELVPPGIVRLSDWRPEEEPQWWPFPEPFPVWGAVFRT